MDHLLPTEGRFLDDLVLIAAELHALARATGAPYASLLVPLAGGEDVLMLSTDGDGRAWATTRGAETELSALPCWHRDTDIRRGRRDAT